MPYLLREGQGKAVALYSRCEDELLCRAELLLLLEKLGPEHAGKPVLGYYDVDPSFTIEEFKRGYRGNYRDHRRLMEFRAKVISEGWPYKLVEKPAQPGKDEGGGPSPTS